MVKTTAATGMVTWDSCCRVLETMLITKEPFLPTFPWKTMSWLVSGGLAWWLKCRSSATDWWVRCRKLVTCPEGSGSMAVVLPDWKELVLNLSSSATGRVHIRARKAQNESTLIRSRRAFHLESFHASSFNRRLGHDVRYGLVDSVSYTRVPSPMIWRSDKAAARWGLQQVREVVYSNRLPLPKSQQLLPRPVKLGLPLPVIHGRVNLNLRRLERANWGELGQAWRVTYTSQGCWF